MKLKETAVNWTKLGKEDPFFAVLTDKDKKGGNWDKKEFFRTGEAAVRKTIDWLEILKVKFYPGKALDFGCGVGRLTQALAAYFTEVHGVDIAPSMIALAKKINQKKNCLYHLNESEDLKIFPEEHFDLIYSKITLQHMEPKYAKNYLKEFLRILKTNGILLFQLPEKPASGFERAVTIKDGVKKFLPEFMLSFWRKITPNRRPLIEMYGIAKEAVIKFLESNGGKVIDIRENQDAGEKWISYEYCVRKI